MAHQRPHRRSTELEIGFADTAVPESEHHQRHAARHPAPPAWISRWERARPTWLAECVAEAFGVFCYVLPGVAATAAFQITTAAKMEGFGSLQNIGLAYCFGVAFALYVAAPTSGGHLSPGITITMVLFKGFPLRKAPLYILSQIIGGMIATLCVYAAYGQSLDQISAALKAAGEEAVVFSSQGPAGVGALFPGHGQDAGRVFWGEWIACTFLAMIIFAVLDPSNVFVRTYTAPFIIGLAYFVAVVAFAPNSISLNTARSLGGQLGAACIYGTGVFSPGWYSAIAHLTNIPATIFGGAIYTLFLQDVRRPHVVDPANPGPEEAGSTNGSGAYYDEKRGGMDQRIERA